MTELAAQERPGLERYAPALADAVAQRAARHLRSAKQAEPVERWRKAVESDKNLQRLLSDLPDAGRAALAVVNCTPGRRLRWDRAVRLVDACGGAFAEAVLTALLQEGLLLLTRPQSDEPISRFETPNGIAPEALPWVEVPKEVPADALPHLRPWLPGLEEHSAVGPWRHADGWDVPLRLAAVWKLASRSPIKRTLQNQLFKRDQDRLAGEPVLTAPPVDAPVPLLDAGMFALAVAERFGMLVRIEDEQRPTGRLRELWPESLDALLEATAAAYLEVDAWQELGASAPPGAFGQDAAAARRFVLLMLAELTDDAGADLGEIGRALAERHAPWHGRGETLGALRQKDQRQKFAEDWARAALLGPMFQLGVVEIATATDARTLVRLTSRGRDLVRGSTPAPNDAVHAQTLFVQPNHQMIVYRQGLTTELLSKLILFADLKNAGPALTFEITADSVYFGLESGITAEEIAALLAEYGGREPPVGVQESLKTWSQRRERLTVFNNCALFEFESAADLQAALGRGLDGVAISERLLLVPGEPAFPNLRIAAQRDYLRLPPEPCVAAEPDGVTLNVDGSRSDLLLESEVARFADRLPDETPGFRPQYRITPESLTRARERGIGSEWLEEWFARRTGSPPPASVAMLLRLGAGAPAVMRPLLVIEVGDESVADGLIQHPETAGLFVARLGPRALATALDRHDEVQAALARLRGESRST